MIDAKPCLLERAFWFLVKVFLWSIVLGVLALIAFTAGLLSAVWTFVLYGFAFHLISEYDGGWEFNLGIFIAIVYSLLLVGVDGVSPAMKMAAGIFFYVFFPIALFKND